MNSASRHWDRVFRKVLQLPEEQKVRIAELLKQQVKQARRHPKYFSAQVYAILHFIEGYREIMPKEILDVTNQIYNIILRDNPPHPIFVMVDNHSDVA